MWKGGGRQREHVDEHRDDIDGADDDDGKGHDDDEDDAVDHYLEGNY